MALAGTPRRFTVASVTYNVAGDANFSKTPEVTTEGIRHTGGTMIKRTLAVGQVEGVKLIVTAAEYSRLALVSKRKTNYPMSYELAAGDVYRAVGQISLGNYESENNTVEITAIPDGEWKEFLSS